MLLGIFYVAVALWFTVDLLLDARFRGECFAARRPLAARAFWAVALGVSWPLFVVWDLVDWARRG